MLYFLILISISAMTAAQLLLKKGLLGVGQFPGSLNELIPFFLKAYTNIYIILAVLMTLVTALAWLLAVSRAQLSFIYPFMALSYVFVAIFSPIFFKEDVTIFRWLGILVICTGVFLISRG